MFVAQKVSQTGGQGKITYLVLIQAIFFSFKKNQKILILLSQLQQFSQERFLALDYRCILAIKFRQ
jgi:hypothetical protein